MIPERSSSFQSGMQHAFCERKVAALYRRVRRQVGKKHKHTGGVDRHKSLVDVMERVIGGLRPEAPPRIDRATADDRFEPSEPASPPTSGRQENGTARHTTIDPEVQRGKTH